MRRTSAENERRTRATREREREREEEGLSRSSVFGGRASASEPKSKEDSGQWKEKRNARSHPAPSTPRCIHLERHTATRRVPGTSAAVSRPRKRAQGEAADAFALSLSLPSVLARRASSLLRSVGRPCPLLSPPPPDEKKNFSFSHPGPLLSKQCARRQSSFVLLHLKRAERIRKSKEERGRTRGKRRRSSSCSSSSHHGRRISRSGLLRCPHQSKKQKNASLSPLTTCTRPSLSTMGAFGSLTQPPLGGARWNAGLSGQRGGSSRRLDCGAANIASMLTPATRRRCFCALLLRCGPAACAVTRSWPRYLRAWGVKRPLRAEGCVAVLSIARASEANES